MLSQRKTTTMKQLLVLFLAISLFYACRYFEGERVRGNGNLITEERSESGFEGVESHGSFDVYISNSSDHSVKVEAEENLQQYIETYVEGGRLKIGNRRGYSVRPKRHIKIYVTGPSFSTLGTYGSGSITGQNTLSSAKKVNIDVAGSGNVEVEINAPSVSAEIAGSGNIRISGSAKDLKTGIYGSGSINAGELKTEEADVQIAGSGNVDVNANNKLNVKVAGSGEVRHKGGASVSKEIAGSGSVIKVD